MVCVECVLDRKEKTVPPSDWEIGMRIMRNTMIGAFVIFLALLYALLPVMGNHALWLAVGGFLAGRGLLLHLAYPHMKKSLWSNSF